ncbi:MAG: GNAT family N-acetyltransferase [Chloroflexota bacterium]
MAFEVRRIRVGEAAAYRDLRLRALTDSPHAFGTTLAEALARPPRWWESRVEATAAGDVSALFVAEDADGWCGLVGGELVGGAVEVISMWVDPRARGTGLGAALVDMVLRWARDHAATEAGLDVTEGNAPAIALYLTTGFAFTGESAPHPSQPGRRELRMRRVLDPVVAG